MNTEILESKWNSLEVPSNNEFNYIRIDGICKPDLMIAVTRENNRCLILDLGQITLKGFNEEKKQNLSTYHRDRENYAIIELLDSYYNDLFNTLVVSLYSQIKDIDDKKLSTQIFVSAISKWADFLSKNQNKLLSETEVKGLLGELLYLKHMAQNDQRRINEILRAWRGPYDENHDFQFDDKDIEIKTKNYSGIEVRISSERQLQADPGKKLELLVVNLWDLEENGITLESTVAEIRNIIIEKRGDMTILLDALLEKKLTFADLEKYSNYQFQLKSFIKYDCDSEDFPSIKERDLEKSIKSVEYSLIIDLLDENLVLEENTF